MTIRDLINALLDHEMDLEVRVRVELTDRDGAVLMVGTGIREIIRRRDRPDRLLFLNVSEHLPGLLDDPLDPED